MSDGRALIAGHSHIVALGVPLKHPHAVDGIVPIESRPDIGGFTGRWERVPSHWDELIRICAGRVIVLSWQGNQHLAHFMLAPEPRIDFVFSGAPAAVDSNAVLVPEIALRQLFQPHHQEMAQLIGKLRAAGARRVVVIGSPPPKEDDQFCRAQMSKEPHFAAMANRFGVDLASVPLSSPQLRNKYWLLLQDVMRLNAARVGAEFLPVPRAAFSPSGGLRREYWADDVTHANRAYGALMLDAIAERLKAA